MKFKEFMTNNDKGIKNLAIFDFDDTLVNTPHPEEGIPVYEKHHGKNWSINNSQWWDSKESLSHPVVPDPAPIRMLNQEVAKEMYMAIQDPETFVVLLTGRHENLRPQVQKVLKD